MSSTRLPTCCSAVTSTRGDSTCPASASAASLIARLSRSTKLINFARIISAARVNTVLERVIGLCLMVKSNALLVIVG